MEDKYMQYSQNAETGAWTPDFPLKEAEMPNLARLEYKPMTITVFNRTRTELWGTFVTDAWVDGEEDVIYTTLDAWETGRELAYKDFRSWLAYVAPICPKCGKKTQFWGVGERARVYRCVSCNDRNRYISEEKHA